MKSRQLLSIIFSLIMFTGVTAGSAAYAQSDELEDLIEDFCELSSVQQSDFFSNNPDMVNFENELVSICEIKNEYDREDALEALIDEIISETRDENEDDNDNDERMNRHDDLEDRLEDYCEMTDDEKNIFFADHPRLAQFENKLENYCDLSEDKRENALEDFIKEHVSKTKDYDFKDKLNKFCKMTDKEKRDFVSEHEKTEDHITKMNEYCELDENERDVYMDENKDKFRINHDKNIWDKLTRYCEMSEQDKKEFLEKYDKAIDHTEKMNQYCELDENARVDYIKEHKDEYKSHMKDIMSDYKEEHKMNVDDMKYKHKEIRDHKAEYERYCKMSLDELETIIDDPERLTKVSEWCDMTPEERDDFKKEHHDVAMDFKEKHQNALERMKEKQDLSPRLRALIMEKHDITDERMDEIKMKYKEKHGDFTDAEKSELKMKFKDHMSSMKFKMSDEHKSAIHDRLAEMKDFKTELRERSSGMTDEEKQELRAEFFEKAKDMQLAWISPRVQMIVGVDAADIECREGFSLLMKASNGVPMCLKADTALKMIEKGIAVPVN